MVEDLKAGIAFRQLLSWAGWLKGRMAEAEREVVGVIHYHYD